MLGTTQHASFDSLLGGRAEPLCTCGLGAGTLALSSPQLCLFCGGRFVSPTKVHGVATAWQGPWGGQCIPNAHGQEGRGIAQHLAPSSFPSPPPTTWGHILPEGCNKKASSWKPRVPSQDATLHVLDLGPRSKNGGINLLFEEGIAGSPRDSVHFSPLLQMRFYVLFQYFKIRMSWLLGCCIC